MIIYAIPGLGTTEKLFINTKIQGVKIVVLNWPVPQKGDTMKSYAKKFLPQILSDEPFCLLGVSFGGMICTELSTLVNPVKTFLVSSCKGRYELPWFIKLLKYFPIHKLISENKHRKMAYCGRWIIGFGKAYIPEYLGMVNAMTENYFKYCIHIIATWDSNNKPSNIVHIHGKDDRLLLYKNVSANYTIDQGSHAMIVFQSKDINKIIEIELNSALQ